MEENSTESSSWRWLLPLVYLSSNWLSLTGVVIVTSATVLWLFLLPTTLRGATAHPYVGIFAFLLLPAVFLRGLALIPLGIWWRRRRSALPASFPPLDFHNIDLRRLIAFIGVTTIANFIIGSQITYAAVNYVDSVTFLWADLPEGDGARIHGSSEFSACARRMRRMSYWPGCLLVRA